MRRYIHQNFRRYDSTSVFENTSTNNSGSVIPIKKSISADSFDAYTRYYNHIKREYEKIGQYFSSDDYNKIIKFNLRASRIRAKPLRWKNGKTVHDTEQNRDLSIKRSSTKKLPIASRCPSNTDLRFMPLKSDKQNSKIFRKFKDESSYSKKPMQYGRYRKIVNRSSNFNELGNLYEEDNVIGSGATPMTSNTNKNCDKVRTKNKTTLTASVQRFAWTSSTTKSPMTSSIPERDVTSSRRGVNPSFLKYSVSSSVPRTPGTSSASKTLVTSPVSKTSVTSSSTKTPMTLPVTKTPVISSGSKPPEISSVYKTPATSSATKAPVTLSVYKTPVLSSACKTTVISSATKIPVTLSISKTHVTSSISVTPVPPSVCKTPVTSSAAKTPMISSVSKTPVPSSIHKPPVISTVQERVPKRTFTSSVRMRTPTSSIRKGVVPTPIDKKLATLSAISIPNSSATPSTTDSSSFPNRSHSVTPSTPGSSTYIPSNLMSPSSSPEPSASHLILLSSVPKSGNLFNRLCCDTRKLVRKMSKKNNSSSPVFKTGGSPRIKNITESNVVRNISPSPSIRKNVK